MKIAIPKLSLVVLIGPSGSGKSFFARKHFLPTEVISSDTCRGMISDDEHNENVTAEAFKVMHHIAGQRLALGHLTVIDATNVQPETRSPLVALARQYHCLPVAIVFDLPTAVCEERNRHRPDHGLGPHVIRNQRNQLHRSLRNLHREGFRHVFVLETQQDIDAVTVTRVPLWNDLSEEHGPFDIIGDVHGCATELEQLPGQLGYSKTDINGQEPGWSNVGYKHEAGRKAIFLGDLVDRGPRVIDTLRIVRNMVHSGSALCVPGNHDIKLLKKLRGRNVQIAHGLAQTLAEIDGLEKEVIPPFKESLTKFLSRLVSHYVLDSGKLVVAHAGLKAELQGRASRKVRDFTLYGETTGETDEFGLPMRHNWAADYRGSAMVVYGHTPVPTPEWLNHTVNIDTGCVYGGKLTALRYPELEFVSVKAFDTYCVPVRTNKYGNDNGNGKGKVHKLTSDEVLDANDVLGKRIISTRLRSNVTIREGHASAALEVMSRFAAHPKWLIYLPPTMSPCETTTLPGLLEDPAEAFAYYRTQGIAQVICEEKHMGTRAIVIVCQDEQTARERFGVVQKGLGIVYSRTGRRFFTDATLEQQFLERVRKAVTTADLWKTLSTNWLCMDCEIMPWSVKAQELLKSQYAAVGAAGNAAAAKALSAIEQTTKRLVDQERDTAQELLKDTQQRQTHLNQFVEAYQHYCWPVNELNDLKLAPFHLLASEGHVHSDKNHEWHMNTLAAVCRADPQLLVTTPYRVIDLAKPALEAEVVAWWTEITERGGEGMVVKPIDFIAQGAHGILQPAIKCRGREYLRIIYGPDYTTEENLSRLRQRSLSRKRSLALNEFALGIEALERFVRREPLRRIHECVYGVLALESEPVDPRL